MFKRHLRPLALVCALFILLSGALCSSTSQHRTAVHQIVFDSLGDGDACSSAAVGSHTLLTAAHCVIGTGYVSVDGNKAKILTTIYDESDHVLIVVDGITFPATLPIEQREARSSEHVEIWGWPGEAQVPVHRDGIFLYVEKRNTAARQMWQLPVYNGDSGSALVSDDGAIIGVVSTGNNSAVAGTYPIQFSPEQYQQIK